MLLPIGALAAITVAIGLFPEPFVAFAEDAAAQLLDPSAYVEAVGAVSVAAPVAGVAE